MTSRMPVLCLACSRYRPQKGTCKAFPDGIPDDIQVFGRDHRTSVNGDNGIVFLQGEEPEHREAFEDWKRVNEAR
jgi:hypothetical protein